MSANPYPQLTLAQHATLRRFVAAEVLEMILDLERRGLAEDAAEYLNDWREFSAAWVLFPQMFVRRITDTPSRVMASALGSHLHPWRRTFLTSDERLSCIILELVMQVRPEFREWLDRETEAIAARLSEKLARNTRSHETRAIVGAGWVAVVVCCSSCGRGGAAHGEQVTQRKTHARWCAEERACSAPFTVPAGRMVRLDPGCGLVYLRLERRSRSRRTPKCAWCGKRIAERWLFRGQGASLHRGCACQIVMRFRRIWQADEIDTSRKSFTRCMRKLPDRPPSNRGVDRTCASDSPYPEPDPEIIKF